MKTHVFLVSGRNPEARARRIEALLSEQAGVGKITLMASTEIFPTPLWRLKQSCSVWTLSAKRAAFMYFGLAPVACVVPPNWC